MNARRVALRAGVTCLSALLAFRLCGLSVSGAELVPRWNGDQLQVTAPRLHFLTGNSLDRLHNGLSVPFDFQLTLSSGAPNNAMERALERFVVSYDLWEERFSVVRLRNGRKSGPHLTAAEAEAWCLDNIGFASAGIPMERNLWLHLEIRSAEAKPASAPGGPGISLETLVELFSRPARKSQEHWSLVYGPFQLAALKR